MAPGFPKQVRGRFPCLKHFPIAVWRFLAHGRVEVHRFIRPPLQRTNVAKSKQCLCAEARFAVGGKEPLVTGGRFAQEAHPFSALCLSRSVMKLLYCPLKKIAS